MLTAPDQQTLIKLFLAGSYTQQDYSMEGVTWTTMLILQKCHKKPDKIKKNEVAPCRIKRTQCW